MDHPYIISNKKSYLSSFSHCTFFRTVLALSRLQIDQLHSFNLNLDACALCFVLFSHGLTTPQKSLYSTTLLLGV